MKQSLFAATAALVFAGSSALAADLPVRSPVYKAAPPSYFSWTGFYVGAYAGGSWGEHTITSGVPGVGFFDNNPFDSYSIHGTGFLAGGTAGYNVQFSNLVLGAEIEGGYLGARKTTVVPDGGDAGDQLNFKYGSYFVAAARLGLAFDRALVYAKGGGAWARVRHVEGDLDLPGPVFDPNFSFNVAKTLSGFAVGGGIEWAWTHNWSIKAEYLFLDFDDFIARDAGGRRYILENNIHTAKIGLNYRFGGPVY